MFLLGTPLMFYLSIVFGAGSGSLPCRCSYPARLLMLCPFGFFLCVFAHIAYSKGSNTVSGENCDFYTLTSCDLLALCSMAKARSCCRYGRKIQHEHDSQDRVQLRALFPFASEILQRWIVIPLMGPADGHIRYRQGSHLTSRFKIR